MRAIDDLEGFAEIAVLRRDHAEQEQRVRVVGLYRESLEAELVGEAEFAPVQRALRLFVPLSYHAPMLRELVAETEADLARPHHLLRVAAHVTGSPFSSATVCDEGAARPHARHGVLVEQVLRVDRELPWPAAEHRRRVMEAEAAERLAAAAQAPSS